MRISYEYTNHKDNPSATRWSMLAGILTTLSVLIVIIIVAFGSTIFSSDYFIVGFIISLVFAIAFVVASIKFCRYMENRAVAKVALEEKLNRQPTEKEIKDTIKGYKEYVKEAERQQMLRIKNQGNNTVTEKVPNENASKFSRLMTSQLAAFWIDSDNEEYREEYIRRIKMCGVSTEQAEEMLALETDILKCHPRPEMLNEDFISTPLFNLKETVLDNSIEYYQIHLEYPLSYITKLSDEAEWHYWNSHEKNLPGDVWEEIYALSDENKKLFLPFGMHLVEKMNWSYGNVNKYTYNEQGMLDRYRWGKSFSAASNNPWN